MVSGFAGLIYESVWSHYLQLFSATRPTHRHWCWRYLWGGARLCAGARWSSRLRQLLLAYVLVEALIGAFGLSFTASSSPPVTTRRYPGPGQSSAWEAQAYKWVLGALLILPQSILLGATFR